MSQLPYPDGRDPYHRANSLEELLEWDDLDFVICAYVTLLGRRPDRFGRAHQLDLIRSGCSKLDVLQRLRSSPEAVSHDPGIAGLDRALERAARERRPLWGKVSRLLRPDADSDSKLDRSIRALLNATKRHQRDLEAIGGRLNGEAASFATSMGAAVPSVLEEAIQVTAMTIAGLPGTDVAGRTPDLDHLRKTRVRKRSIGGGAS